MLRQFEMHPYAVVLSMFQPENVSLRPNSENRRLRF